MKTKKIFSFVLLVISMFFTLNCESSKSAKKSGNQLLEIEMEAIGKGNSLKMVVNEKMYEIHEKIKGDGNANSSKSEENTSAKLWDNFKVAVEKLDLNEFESWTGTEQNRLYDGARATTISISTNGKTLTSQPFDEGNPPSELQELYQLLIDLKK